MMRYCQNPRCQTAYLDMKSTSELRLTYCSMMCQMADLKFNYKDFLARPAPVRAVTLIEELVADFLRV